jgi:hypothetical protein
MRSLEGEITTQHPSLRTACGRGSFDSGNAMPLHLSGVRFVNRGRLLVMLAMAFLGIALLMGLLPNQPPSREKSESKSPVRSKTRERTASMESVRGRRREVDARIVQRWMDELLERYPQLKFEKREVPDEENGFLAWTKFSSEILEGVELPDCLEEYLSSPNAINRRCAEEWLNQHSDLETSLSDIARLPDQSMGNARLKFRLPELLKAILGGGAGSTRTSAPPPVSLSCLEIFFTSRA